MREGKKEDKRAGGNGSKTKDGIKVVRHCFCSRGSGWGRFTSGGTCGRCVYYSERGGGGSRRVLIGFDNSVTTKLLWFSSLSRPLALCYAWVVIESASRR